MFATNFTNSREFLFLYLPQIKRIKMILSPADLADSANLFYNLHYKNLSNLLNLREKICVIIGKIYRVKNHFNPFNLWQII